MAMSMPKSRQTWALIGLLVLFLAIVVALYYMRKNKSREGFDAVDDDNVQREMSDTLIETTSIKPNLTPAKGVCVVALFYADW